MPKPLETLNIKDTMPTAEAAWTHCEGAMEGARLRGVRILKVVHGYGSGGVGGKIRRRVRAGLAKLLDAQRLGGVVAFPALRGDADYGKGNEGITLVRL